MMISRFVNTPEKPPKGPIQVSWHENWGGERFFFEWVFPTPTKASNFIGALLLGTKCHRHLRHGRDGEEGCEFNDLEVTKQTYFSVMVEDKTPPMVSDLSWEEVSHDEVD